MKIGIDASNLRRGGGRTHLIEILYTADPARDNFCEIFVWGSKETLDKLHNRPWLRKIWKPELELGIFRRMLWQKFSLGTEVRKFGCNILFIPGGNFSTNFRPIVTMSRNMLPFEWKEFRRYGNSKLTVKMLLLRFYQTRSFRSADGVIFLTDYSKKAVMRVTGDLKGQISVIPHGLNTRFFVERNSIRARAMPVDGCAVHLLYVSIVDHYKHQWNVVEGVAKARKQTGIDLQLNLVGPAYEPALRKLNSAIARDDPQGKWVHYLGAIDYKQLHNNYADANIGIFASSCENMPNILLENMATGLPIACSNRGPMPEILGDAGVYFDPEDINSITNSLMMLINSDQLCLVLAQNAFEKAQNYSWKRCAIETFSFIGSTLQKHKKYLEKQEA